MSLRSWLLFLLFAAPTWWGTAQVRAQCLPLDLLAPGMAAGRIAPDSVTELMEPSDWVLHRGPNPYWTYRTPGEAETPEERAEAWVGLRRSNQQPYYDLVYKTTHRSCINQIWTDLRREAKLKSEPVNCVQCDGERLVGKGYTVSIFIQKAGYSTKRTAYPFVLVLRRSVAGAKSSDPLPEVSSQITKEQ
ncbi:MAG: hypothetical protein EOO56_06480 [Hymenobacter sp.]|nr:MAG: hypothetical protein EOO56_06480 [Hymenobacter sp.]